MFWPESFGLAGDTCSFVEFETVSPYTLEAIAVVASIVGELTFFVMCVS